MARQGMGSTRGGQDATGNPIAKENTLPHIDQEGQELRREARLRTRAWRQDLRLQKSRVSLFNVRDGSIYYRFADPYLKTYVSGDLDLDEAEQFLSQPAA